MIIAFLGGAVGSNPKQEVFDFYRNVKLELYRMGFLPICPLDISEDIYWKFGDNREAWKELSRSLISAVDLAIFMAESPAGTLKDSEGSQLELEVCRELRTPVLICRCLTVKHSKNERLELRFEELLG